MSAMLKTAARHPDSELGKFIIAGGFFAKENNPITRSLHPPPPPPNDVPPEAQQQDMEVEASHDGRPEHAGEEHGQQPNQRDAQWPADSWNSFKGKNRWSSWKQHEKKSGVFFHEEGVFSLWTMKVLWQADLVILIGNLPKNRDGKSAA